MVRVGLYRGLGGLWCLWEVEVMASREQRAREVLATELEVENIPYLTIIADQFRRGVSKTTNDAVVRAAITFANAELERAADRCLGMADMIGAMPGSSIASALSATSDSILDMRNDD